MGILGKCSESDRAERVDLDPIGNLNKNRLFLDTHDRSMDASGGQDLISLLQPVKHALPFFLPFLLRADDHEIENDKNQTEHDERAGHATSTAVTLPGRLHEKQKKCNQWNLRCLVNEFSDLPLAKRRRTSVSVALLSTMRIFLRRLPAALPTSASCRRQDYGWLPAGAQESLWRETNA